MYTCGADQGLVHLHGLGIIHGDLKPGNVLLDDHGRPLIADWGFSRVSSGFTRTRATATSIGFTDEYAAPEVLAGQRTSTASDMYVCVAATAVACLTTKAHRYSFGCIVDDVVQHAAADGGDVVKELKVWSRDAPQRGCETLRANPVPCVCVCVCACMCDMDTVGVVDTRLSHKH